MLIHTDHIVRIKRDGFNPLTGFAQFRVVSCTRSVYPEFKRVHIYNQPPGQTTIVLHRPVRVGSIINPRKALFHD